MVYYNIKIDEETLKIVEQIIEYFERKTGVRMSRAQIVAAAIKKYFEFIQKY